LFPALVDGGRTFDELAESYEVTRELVADHRGLNVELPAHFGQGLLPFQDLLDHSALDESSPTPCSMSSRRRNRGTSKPPHKDRFADSATISCMFLPLSFGYKGPIKSYFWTPFRFVRPQYLGVGAAAEAPLSRPNAGSISITWPTTYGGPKGIRRWVERALGVPVRWARPSGLALLGQVRSQNPCLVTVTFSLEVSHSSR
jgi:hypothetical protein